ncbi:hypothetical protein ACIGG6_02315 [Vreelandella lionensis]|uniref:Uncharacterized protein n=1 Tax=Vreelandella lionensis TaxID=1144478 RepID=A0ABW8BQI8_9GAMM
MNKKVMFSALFSLTSMLMSANTFAQAYCEQKNTQICEQAQNMASMLAPSLPMRINSNTVIQTVFAADNAVYLNTMYDYNRSYLEQVYAEMGLQDQDIMQALTQVARGSVCNPSVGTADFINSGGAVIYSYHFSDGEKYTDIEIRHCN